MESFVLADARVATMVPGPRWGAIDRGAIAVEGEAIAWVGTESGLPDRYRGWPCQPQGGRWITPGLIDCHTHLVHAGDRAAEFAQRLEGATYAEIAEGGGGILSTVRATRAAAEDELVRQSLPRLEALIAEGVTTVEIKSGYGLTTDSEVRMLRAARRLGRLRDVEVVTTFLGAHAVPPEFSGRGDAYIDHLIVETLPAVAGLADAIDAFCETIAFTPAQVRRLFLASDLPRKLHTEQLSDGKGAVMAAGMGALSCDHLEYLALDGVRAMAASGSVAVLLPGAFYTLRETTAPPVDLLRAHAVPIAVATDCNPGSSPLTSILTAMNMACTLLRLTPEEALAGVTREAGRALGRGGTIGTIEPGKRADLCVWDIDDPAELAYRIGFNPLARRLRGGR